MSAAAHTSPQSPSPTSKIGSLVRRGSFISVGSYGLSQIIRLGGNLILTRLLFQEVFGLMALIQVLIVGLHLFSDVGIGPSIVQNEKGDDPEFLDTAFSVQFARGLSLWIICCIAAAPFAAFYNEEQLAQLIPVAGFGTVIAGLQSTKYWTYQRELRVGRLALLDLTSQFVSLVLMVVLAWVTKSVWSLVIAGLAGDAIRTILSHVALTGHRNRLRVHRPSLDRMIRFGRWIFFSTVISFCVSQTDRLIFGKLTSLEVLATYSIAVVLAAMPSSALWHLTGTVLLPAYSRIHQAKGKLPAEDFLQVRGPMMLGAAWMLSGMVAGGTVIIDILYDERYADAGWMVQVLSAGAWFMVLDATVAPALMAQGESKWMAAGNAAKLAGMALLIPVGFHLAEFPGAVVGYATSEFCRYALSTAVAQRKGLRPLLQDARCTVMLVIGSTAGWLAARGMAELTELAVLKAVAVFVAVTAVFYPSARPAIARFRESRRAAVAA